MTSEWWISSRYNLGVCDKILTCVTLWPPESCGAAAHVIPGAPAAILTGLLTENGLWKERREVIAAISVTPHITPHLLMPGAPLYAPRHQDRTSQKAS